MSNNIKELYPSEIYPALQEVDRYLKKGEYKRVPICLEILSDKFTAVEVLRIMKKHSEHAFLFESADSSHKWGRYSFIGFDPSLEITCLNGTITISTVDHDRKERKEIIKTSHPGDEIRKLIKKYKSPKIDKLPTLSGGLVGYFAYDYMKYAEPTLKFTNKKGDDFRDVDLMLFDSIIALDNLKQKIILITGVNTGNIPENSSDDTDRTVDSTIIETLYLKAQKKLYDMAEILLSGDKEESNPLRINGKLSPEYSEERFCEMVNTAKHYIKEGDIFQVVLSNPITAKAEGSLLDTYRILRTENPSPYMFYFSSNDVEIVGASPETLVKLENRRVYTFPLAGTRPRGKDDEEDLLLEKDLLSDEKECAEHNMLVDLGRNDIGRVSKVGSVNVEKYMVIEKFSHVMHIGSTVTGEIRDDYDAINAIDSILPAGTLSGAPKIRACEIIEELEDRKRGIYGGAIGYLDFSGNLDTGIGMYALEKSEQD